MDAQNCASKDLTICENESDQNYERLNLKMEKFVQVINNMTRKFVPSRIIVDSFVKNELNLQSDKTKDLSKLVETLHFFEIKKLEVSDEKWIFIYNEIFKGRYPLVEREVFYNGAFCCSKYIPASLIEPSFKSFKIKLFDPIGKPKRCVQYAIASELFDYEPSPNPDKPLGKLEPTLELERFLNLEAIAISRGSIHEVIVPSRPLYGVKNGFKLSKTGLIIETIIPEILGMPDENIFAEFIHDLMTSFGFKSEGTFGAFFGYLIAPFLVPIAPGEFPIPLFEGPPGSGKTTLAVTLPRYLYQTVVNNVVETRLKKDDYENEIFFSELQNAVFLIFDEIIDATPEQLKMIDHLATSKQITYRKIRQGSGRFDNNLVIALTAVHKNFSSETARRTTTIQLDQVNTDSIQIFIEKYEHKWATIFASLNEKVQKVEFAFSKIKRFHGRGRGFGILSYFVYEILGIEPTWTSPDLNVDILFELISAYEAHMIKNVTQRGRWVSISPSAALKGILQNNPSLPPKLNLVPILRTALPHGSTEMHQQFKDGFVSESGKKYHISLKDDGRTTINISCLN